MPPASKWALGMSNEGARWNRANLCFVSQFANILRLPLEHVKMHKYISPSFKWKKKSFSKKKDLLSKKVAFCEIYLAAATVLHQKTVKCSSSQIFFKSRQPNSLYSNNDSKKKIKLQNVPQITRIHLYLKLVIILPLFLMSATSSFCSIILKPGSCVFVVLSVCK